jgi:hypothetical protein
MRYSVRPVGRIPTLIGSPTLSIESILHPSSAPLAGRLFALAHAAPSGQATKARWTEAACSRRVPWKAYVVRRRVEGRIRVRIRGGASLDPTFTASSPIGHDRGTPAGLGEDETRVDVDRVERTLAAAHPLCPGSWPVKIILWRPPRCAGVVATRSRPAARDRPWSRRSACLGALTLWSRDRAARDPALETTESLVAASSELSQKEAAGDPLHLDRIGLLDRGSNPHRRSSHRVRKHSRQGPNQNR